MTFSCAKDQAVRNEVKCRLVVETCSPPSTDSKDLSRFWHESFFFSFCYELSVAVLFACLQNKVMKPAVDHIRIIHCCL